MTYEEQQYEMNRDTIDGFMKTLQDLEQGWIGSPDNLITPSQRTALIASLYDVAERLGPEWVSKVNEIDTSGVRVYVDTGSTVRTQSSDAQGQGGTVNGAITLPNGTQANNAATSTSSIIDVLRLSAQRVQWDLEQSAGAQALRDEENADQIAWETARKAQITLPNGQQGNNDAASTLRIQQYLKLAAEAQARRDEENADQIAWETAKKAQSATSTTGTKVVVSDTDTVGGQKKGWVTGLADYIKPSTARPARVDAGTDVGTDEGSSMTTYLLLAAAAAAAWFFYKSAR